RGVGLQLAAIHEDHAVGEIVVQNRDGGWRLEDALPPGKSVSLRAARQTLIRGTRPVVLPQTLLDQLVDPRLRVGGVRVGVGNWPVPYTAQIDLAVGSARRGRCEVRLAVRCPRTSRGFPLAPPGAARDCS